MEVRAKSVKRKSRRSWKQVSDCPGWWLISVVVCFVYDPVDISVKKSKTWLYMGKKSIRIESLAIYGWFKIFCLVQNVHIFGEDIDM